MKMKCNKPCKEKAHCSHHMKHEKTADCVSGCDNGAVCEPVVKITYRAVTDEEAAANNNIVNITKERGANYGHPLHHFPLTRALSGKWIEARRAAIMRGSILQDDDREMALAHAVYMICDKLARLATNPMHTDSWDDVQGYARTAKMALGLEQ